MIRVRKEYEKVGLKFNIQKNNIMAPSPIILWQIDRETVADFIFLGSRITVDSDAAMKLTDACSLEGNLSQTQTVY